MLLWLRCYETPPFSSLFCCQTCSPSININMHLDCNFRNLVWLLWLFVDCFWITSRSLGVHSMVHLMWPFPMPVSMGSYKKLVLLLVIMCLLLMFIFICKLLLSSERLFHKVEKTMPRKIKKWDIICANNVGSIFPYGRPTSCKISCLPCEICFQMLIVCINFKNPMSCPVTSHESMGLHKLPLCEMKVNVPTIWWLWAHVASVTFFGLVVLYFTWHCLNW